VQQVEVLLAELIIRAAALSEHFSIFGMKVAEVHMVRQQGYPPKE